VGKTKYSGSCIWRLHSSVFLTGQAFWLEPAGNHSGGVSLAGPRGNFTRLPYWAPGNVWLRTAKQWHIQHRGFCRGCQ
jgi:hypothetical protein